MSAVKEVVTHLISSGMDPAEAAALIAAVAAELLAKKRSSGAERTAKWREKKASQDVTKRHSVTSNDRNETVTNRHNVTPLSPPSPPKEVSPYNPLQEITPSPSPISNSRPSVASDFPADGFEQFWRTYPRREAKQACKKKYDVLRKNGQVPFAKLLSGARRYAEHHRGTDPQYIKQPLTWLNQGCWDDELPSKREQGGFRWNGIEGVI